MGRLQDRVAIVTGAGRGIGAAIARRFVAEGCRLVLADLDAEQVAAVTDELLELFPQTGRKGRGAHPVDPIIGIGCDVVYDDVPRTLVDTAVSHFGGLDIVVNNAGTATMGFLDAASNAELTRVMDVNLKAVLRLTHAAKSALLDSDAGRVINLASVEGIRGSGLLPIYCASKHAVVGLTRANAIELGRHGVTVNCICPGPIETQMLQPLIATPMQRERLVHKVPLKRLGQPEDVAAAALFLASDDAAFVNGHTLVVDGGLTVHA